MPQWRLEMGNVTEVNKRQSANQLILQAVLLVRDTNQLRSVKNS